LTKFVTLDPNGHYEEFNSLKHLKRALKDLIEQSGVDPSELTIYEVSKEYHVETNYNLRVMGV
jgi:hypothetical protein